MSRLLCKCGESLSNSNNPEIVYKVFSDNEWLELMDKEIKNNLNDIERPKLAFWKCTNCQRLYFFEAHNDTPLKVFTIETDNDKAW